MLSQGHKQIVIWLLTGCTLIFAMVIIGGITRLTGSGLSITEWKVIMGTFPPMNDVEWQIVYEKYQQSPQFQKVNFNMNLSDFKSIFWWEYIHRLLGRIIGFVFIIPFIYFLTKGYFKEKSLVKKLSVLFLLGGFQGFLGWFMVKSGLQDNPHVSHYRLAAHLITAFFVYGFTFWFALDILFPERSRNIGRLKTVKLLSRVLFFLVVIQIIYGAFVAGLKAGRIYNTWPKMGTRWIPEGLSSMDPFVRNIFENMTTIQFIHRNIAIVLVILSIVIWYKLKDKADALQSKAINILINVILIQFCLGIFTLIYSVPITLGILHQAGALMLFTSVIFLIHRLK